MKKNFFSFKFYLFFRRVTVVLQQKSLSLMYIQIPSIYIKVARAPTSVLLSPVGMSPLRPDTNWR